ncbi:MULTISPECIES: hypothetical protein [Burkholderia]|uniref:hypothetical protein n=1 Tax=Burkholderia TaxID=32008 RepID=UPI0011A3D8D6|nr:MULTISPECIES: hypothetical protein [Burkholderia]
MIMKEFKFYRWVIVVNRPNAWSKMLLAASIALLLSAVSAVNWNAVIDGQTFIPIESSLIKIGPFSVSESKKRAGENLVFSDPRKNERYIVDVDDLNRKFSLSQSCLSDHQENIEAYLFVSSKNSARKIWKIEMCNEIVMSYERSIENYKRDNGFLWSSIIGFSLFFIWFLLSLMDIGRKI